MVNDKVFLILWWWFLFLAIVGALRIVYRIIQTLYDDSYFYSSLTFLSVGRRQ